MTRITVHLTTGEPIEGISGDSQASISGYNRALAEVSASIRLEFDDGREVMIPTRNIAYIETMEV